MTYKNYLAVPKSRELKFFEYAVTADLAQSILVLARAGVAGPFLNSINGHLPHGFGFVLLQIALSRKPLVKPFQGGADSQMNKFTRGVRRTLRRARSP